MVLMRQHAREWWRFWLTGLRREVREFRQRHAGTQVSLFELPPRAQLDRLRARELDAAVLGEEPVTVEVETLVSLLRDHRRGGRFRRGGEG